MIRAYVMRHGSTTISPAPEGWQQVALDARGIIDAQEGAHCLQSLIRSGYPTPGWGVSSDLERAKQTLTIVARRLGIETMEPMFGLRAYEQYEETAISYEARNIAAFRIILSRADDTGTVPLIVCHRSSTAFLGKHTAALKRNPDYRQDMLLKEGGILAITNTGLKPLFRVVKENWK